MTDAYGPDGPGLGMASGFSTSIGMHMEEVSGTRVRGWVDVGPNHLQPGSIVHGGLYASVVEEAASYGASVAVRDRGQRVVGVTNTTNFIRSVSSGRILVEATSSPSDISVFRTSSHPPTEAVGDAGSGQSGSIRFKRILAALTTVS